MDEFHTFRESMQDTQSNLTPSMEDYLEMIFRLSTLVGFTRINDLAFALNVQPSSVSRMIQKLNEAGYVKYEKYSVVLLNDKGKMLGEKLLLRHKLSEEFLRMIGVTENVLDEAEKVEHTLSQHTLERMTAFIAFIKTKPNFLKQYTRFCKL